LSADQVFTWANWLLLASLIVGVVATFAIVVSGRERDAASKRELARAQEGAAIANERAAGLERDAAAARLETERLKGLLAWRRISPDQTAHLVAALRGKVTGRVWVEHVDSDPEATQFHDDIWRTLQAAQLNLAVFHGWQRLVGLTMTNSNTPDGQALKAAFAAAGIVFVDDLVPSMGGAEKDVELRIGSKQPALFTSGVVAPSAH
jgi:hypothetical protein